MAPLAIALLLLAAVEIGDPFGTAVATVKELDEETMTIDIEVQVRGTVDSVVMHLSFGGRSVGVHPLLDRGNGSYGVETVLEPLNYQVVFEAVGQDGGISDPVSLTRLGAELTPESETTTTASTVGNGLSPATQRMGWLALALGAAALSALAIWALGGNGRRSDSSDEEE